MEFDLLFLTDGIEAIEDISGDSTAGGLRRVRQKATRADAKNSNGRIYPKAVLQEAIERARAAATAGAMLSELEHPELAQTRSGKRKFTDSGTDAKSARVVEISDVRDDGWVTVTRVILDTPAGRQVADALDRGEPFGISTRFEMQGRAARYNGQRVVVADTMAIHTFDDVRNPAVYQAGAPEPLTDSVEFGTSDTGRKMKKIYKSLLDAWREALQATDAEAIYECRSTTYDAIKAALSRNESNLEQVISAATALELDTASQGYTSGRPAPTFVSSRELGVQMKGWGPDVEAPRPSETPAATIPTSASQLGDNAEVQQALSYVKQAQAREAAERLTQEIHAAVDSMADKVEPLPENYRAHVLSQVKTRARTVAEVEPMMDAEVAAVSKLIADMRLSQAGGTTVTVQGRTVEGQAEVPDWMQAVDFLCQEADNYRQREGAHMYGPEDVVCQHRRAYNRRTFIDPLIDTMAARRGNQRSMEEWFQESDSIAEAARSRPLMEVLRDSDLSGHFRDATTTSNLMNQPVISTYILIQSFQDMRFLQWVMASGPGASGFDLVNNDPRIGKVIRIASEYLTPPTSYGIIQNNYTGGLAVAENVGIPEIIVGTYFTHYNTVWRRTAASLTAEAIKEIGHGPLNYSSLGRHLFHMAFLKSRVMDKILGDEMLAASDEYGAVAVAAEAPSLADNSEYNAGGSVSINMNPAKQAVAAVASGDMSRTYGAGVVAAIRLQTRGLGTASPYMGTASGADPIVTPKTKIDYSAAGAQSATTLFSFAIAGAGAQVEGYLDDNGVIQTKAGGGSPTYAVDWEHGVVVFNAAGYTAAGWGNAAGVLTGGTATFDYTYSTNHTSFTVGESMVTLGTGQTWEDYLSGLMRTFDTTAALMGSAPRFVSPNLGLMSLNASVHLTAASIFYKFLSPPGTELAPTEDFFANRTGIRFARHNSPWRGVDRRILLTRQGTTHYHVDTPFEIRGPLPAYDSGLAVARDIFYAQENNLVATPQPLNSSGAVINPVARSIILRS